MREDMFKVIVNRPRWGHRHAPRSKTRYDKCPDRARVTGHRMMLETKYTKHLNENLAPLKRFLHKQRGRKWNDVFSEICQHLDTGSTVKMHVREHLQDFINYNTKQKADGSLYASDRWGGYATSAQWHAELYVDPADGIIKETRELCKRLKIQYRRDYYRNYCKAKPGPEGIKKLNDLSYRVQLSGIWYQLKFSSKPRHESGHEMSLEAVYSSLRDRNRHALSSFKIAEKRQLSSKELKALKLKNKH